jgi:chorismate dehydratase
MDDRKYNISVVSYTNTLPFKVALENDNSIKAYANLTYDNPAVCAQKLLNDDADIGLIPVGVLPLLDNYQIISDYCIGAVGQVETVKLYSNIPVNKLKTIYLDPQSRTSVNLVQVLAAKYWNTHLQFEKGDDQMQNENLQPDEGFVLIGDRTFGLSSKYVYEYDLAEEWQKFTGLPFVFAAWVANKPIEKQFVQKFNEILQNGIDMIPQIAKSHQKEMNGSVDLYHYFTHCISYPLDDDKKKALNLFLSYMNELAL